MITKLLLSILLFRDSWDGDSPSLNEKFTSLIIVLVVIVIAVLYLIIASSSKKK